MTTPATPAPYEKRDDETLFDAIVRLDIAYASHYSDLYLPNTAEVRAVLQAYGVTVNGHNASYFRNQVEGGIWIDVPFAYAPYWRQRGL